jgi:hypothetical protein
MMIRSFIYIGWSSNDFFIFFQEQLKCSPESPIHGSLGSSIEGDKSIQSQKVSLRHFALQCHCAKGKEAFQQNYYMCRSFSIGQIIQDVTKQT